MLASRPPSLDQRRKSVSEITATGMDALTVIPTFKTRYKEEAPNNIPSNVPIIRARGVNSGKLLSGETYGRKAGRDSRSLGRGGVTCSGVVVSAMRVSRRNGAGPESPGRHLLNPIAAALQ